MIAKITTKNFSILKDTNLEFARGINVIIGSNGTGKSHLLKLAYTAARWSYEMSLREKSQARPDKATLQKELGTKLIGVFRCDGLGRLSTRGQGVQRTEVSISFHKSPKANFGFSFSTKSITDTVLEKTPSAFFEEESVFFPTKEMLTMFPGFASLYRNYQLQIDETYYDLCLALEKPMPRGPKLLEVRPMLEAVEDVLQGSIQLERGRFYLIQKAGGKFEIPLVAEGFRKIGAVAYLLANGTLANQSILFWDEPETNLNPAYMTKVVKLLVALAKNKTQVFLATHSVFMMRALSLCLAEQDNAQVDRKFFALEASGSNQGVVISYGASAEDVEPITALDAEIEQSEDYLRLEGTSI